MNTDRRNTEPANRPAACADARLPQYEIRVGGHLGTRWDAWFDGMTLTDEDDGTTVIRGPVVDQAALHGLLQRLRDLGISLLSLARVAPGTAIERPSPPHDRTPHNPPGARS